MLSFSYICTCLMNEIEERYHETPFEDNAYVNCVVTEYLSTYQSVCPTLYQT